VRSRRPNWGLPGRTRMRESSSEAGPRLLAIASLTPTPLPLDWPSRRDPYADVSTILAITWRPARRADDELGRCAGSVMPSKRRGGLDSARRRRGQPAPSFDPAAFERTPRGTEKFLGRDNALSPSSPPRPRRTGPDPVNLFGAATCGRTNPNLSGARRVRRGTPHREATAKSVKKRQRRRNGPLTFEAINRLAATCSLPATRTPTESGSPA
jgi:hypothetical protein